MGTVKENKRKDSGKEVKNINPAHKGSGINSNFKKKERTKSKLRTESQTAKKK